MRQNARVGNGLIWGVRIVVLLVFFGIVWSLVKNYFELSKLDERVSEAQKINYTLKLENDKLIEEAQEASLSASQERAIRNKLGLVQPGETVVIIADKDIDPLLDNTSQTDEFNMEEFAEAEKQIWQKWMELFFL